MGNIKNFTCKNKLISKFVRSFEFRTYIFSACSFIVGIGLVTFYVVIYVITKSLWCGAMAFYHILLVVLRGYILSGKNKKRAKCATECQRIELKHYRFCGIAFITLTLCLFAMITHIVRGNKVFSYDMFVTYTIACFTLYQIIIAIINYVKARKDDSYIVRALRSINLTTALVSLISLQAITLDTFSRNINIPIVNTITGIAVCCLIVINGVYMIVRASKKLKSCI